MKKLLAILLTLIFTFSCFGILGAGTAFAEETAVNYGEVIFKGSIFLLAKEVQL